METLCRKKNILSLVPSFVSLSLSDVSQLSYLEDEPRDLALSESEPRLVWALLLNGILLGIDPETREKVAKVCYFMILNFDLHPWPLTYLQIIVPNMTPHSFCTCFTIWREFLWVGTNKGSIAILSTINRSCVTELYFPGSHRQVDIKYLAVSSEDEVCLSTNLFFIIISIHSSIHPSIHSSIHPLDMV